MKVAVNFAPAIFKIPNTNSTLIHLPTIFNPMKTPLERTPFGASHFIKSAHHLHDNVSSSSLGFPVAFHIGPEITCSNVSKKINHLKLFTS